MNYKITKYLLYALLGVVSGVFVLLYIILIPTVYRLIISTSNYIVLSQYELNQTSIILVSFALIYIILYALKLIFRLFLNVTDMINEELDENKERYNKQNNDKNNKYRKL